MLNEEISASNAVNLLQQLPFKNDVNGFYQKVIDFISKNFDDVDNKERLSVDELEMIFSNESFQIYSESLLFKFITNYIDENGENAKVLLSYVEYQNLLSSDIEQFLHIINLNEVNDLMWEKLKIRLLLNFSIPDERIKNNKRYKIDSSINYPVIDNQRFKGIFYNLNQKCGGNCSENDVVDVKCSKIQEDQQATDLTDFDNTGDHYTWIDNQLNGYFEFDFKDKKVVISNYEFQTPDSDDDNGYPKNWSIECSDDGKEWFVIDNVRNDEHLNGPNKHHLFEVKQPINKPCKYVRIYQRGPSHYSNKSYYFGLYLCLLFARFCQLYLVFIKYIIYLLFYLQTLRLINTFYYY